MNRIYRTLLAITLTILLFGNSHTMSIGQASTRHLDLASGRVVMTDYLNQWTTAQTSGYWDGWDWEGDGCHVGSHNPYYVLSDGRRDIASAYYPLIGPYDAGEQTVMEYHVRLAQVSGIDAFLFDWWGTLDFGDFPRINSNFLKLLSVTERMNFPMALEYDAHRFYLGENGPGVTLFHNRTKALRQIQDDLAYAITHFGHSPNYLTYSGLPVFFIWGGTSVVSGGEWKGIFDALNAEGLRAAYFHVYFTSSYYPVFSGFTPWFEPRPVATGQTTPAQQVHDAADTLRRIAANYRITWGLNTWPGFDATPVTNWCTVNELGTVDRKNGAVYNQTWQAAISSSPTWVDIATWNDWNEGTVIEPTVQFRYQYLYLTAYYSAQFKHQIPNFDGIPVPLAIYNATLAIRQAKSDLRLTGLDAANETLERAEEAFQSGKYDFAMRYASQAIEMAHQATISTSVTSTTFSPFVVSETMSTVSNQGISSEVLYWALSWIVIGLVVLVVIVLVLPHRKHTGDSGLRSS